MSLVCNYSLKGNGKSAVISASISNAFSSEGGLSYVFKGPAIADISQAFKPHFLPPEDSPFTAGQKIRQTASEMRSLTGTNLDTNITWLIEVIIPRLMLSDEGVRSLQEPTLRNSSLGQFLLNSGVSARNDDPVMSGESILAQLPTTVSGVPFIPLHNETEMATLAVSVLRASFRDAIVTETVQPNGETRRSVGIFVGSDELVNFCFSPFHPDFVTLALYSDTAVKSMLVLESAENMFGRVFMSEIMPQIPVEDKIAMIRKRAELAGRYWEDNPAVPRFLEALDTQRHLGNLQEQCETIYTHTINLLQDVSSKGIGSKGGLFSRSKPGLSPEFIESEAIKLINSAVEVVKIHGQNIQTFSVVSAIAAMCVTLGQLGVPDRIMENIVRHRVSKLGL